MLLRPNTSCEKVAFFVKKLRKVLRVRALLCFLEKSRFCCACLCAHLKCAQPRGESSSPSLPRRCLVVARTHPQLLRVRLRHLTRAHLLIRRWFRFAYNKCKGDCVACVEAKLLELPLWGNQKPGGLFSKGNAAGKVTVKMKRS